MKYIDYITLFALSRLNGERTSSSIYHILRGKKSSQTIQDCHLYDLAFLFHILPNLERFIIRDSINTLLSRQFITEKEADHFLLTQDGKRSLNHFMDEKGFPKHLNGWEFEQQVAHFWPRLSLVVQTLSYLIEHNRSFIPLTNEDSVLFWVKKFFREIALGREEIAKQLKDELRLCLVELPTLEADIFTLKLSRVKRAGLTNGQLAEELRVDPFEIEVLFKSALHRVIRIASSKQLPYLSKFLDQTNQQAHLTDSTAKTYQLLMLKKTAQVIAAERNLKMSTIEDHLVELALQVNQFDITPYVNLEDQKKIKRAIANTNTKKLKVIKNELDDRISYFQIRLVLAKDGNNHGS